MGVLAGVRTNEDERRVFIELTGKEKTQRSRAWEFPTARLSIKLVFHYLDIAGINL